MNIYEITLIGIIFGILWYCLKNYTFKKELTDAEYAEAKELLGDKVTRYMSRIGVAQLVEKRVPNCGCAGRRAALNNFHRKLLGIKEGNYIVRFIPKAKYLSDTFAAWCEIDHTIYLVYEPEKALTFDSEYECDKWCHDDSDNLAMTPLFFPVPVRVYENSKVEVIQ